MADEKDKFPRVGLIETWAPVDAPQYIPGNPHNLPPRRDRPNRIGSGVTLIGGDDGPTGAPSTGGLGGVDPIAIWNPHAYANIIEGTFIVSATTSQKFLDEPTSRRNLLMIRNSSAAANVYVSFGRDASVIGSIIRLAANQIVLFDTVVPQDDVYVIGDAAGSIAYGYSTISL